MIATRRGLVILAAIAGVLLVVLVVDLARTKAPTEHTLVPGFDEASVTRMQWTAHPVGPYLTLERTKGGPWRRTAPTPGAVEQAPIASLLATLRGARWHRTETRDPRENVAAHLAIDGGQHLELWIGRADGDSEQAWIRIGDRSYLVDAWVTRALQPSPLDLAIRAPLAGIANVDTYTVDGVRIAHRPARLVDPPLLLDADLVISLERALAELVIDTLPPSPMGHGEAITVTMAGTTVAFGGPCEQRVYLAASTGDGCVPRDKADAASALVAKLHAPPAAIVSRALVPDGVERVVLADGSHLDLTKRPRIESKDADYRKVAELMAVLRQAVDADDVVAAPATKATGTVTASLGGRDDIVIDLHPGNVAHRRGEPVALRLSPAAFAVLARGATAYADPIPWREEPTTIDEIQIDQVTYKRGAVLGEWTRTPAGPSDAASIDALVSALADPHVLDVAPATVTNGRKITLFVRPPVGGEKSHTIELGTAIATGCPARIEGANLLLPVEICRLVPR